MAELEKNEAVRVLLLVGAGKGFCSGADLKDDRLSGGELGTTYFLPKAVGRAKAAEILLTGRAVEAEEADRIGLVSRLVDEASLMGTAFLATRECPVHDAIKERLVQTRANETCLLLNSLQNPVRCVKNKLAEECLDLEEKNASFEEIFNTVAGGKGKLAYDCGDAEISLIACGQVVGAIDKIKTVKDVIDDIVNESGSMMDRLKGMMACQLDDSDLKIVITLTLRVPRIRCLNSSNSLIGFVQTL